MIVKEYFYNIKCDRCGAFCDEDKFATESTFNGECKIIPPKNHLIGTILTTERGRVVEFIDKSKVK